MKKRTKVLIVIGAIMLISIIFGTIDYYRAKDEKTPLFAVYVGKSGIDAKIYVGLGYTVSKCPELENPNDYMENGLVDFHPIMLFTHACFADTKNLYINRVSIWKTDEEYGTKLLNDVLGIDDTLGLILFNNLIENATKIDNISDVKESPYIVDINYDDKDETIYFYIEKDSGMYINTKDTNYSYTFKSEDVKIFMDEYSTYFKQ